MVHTFRGSIATDYNVRCLGLSVPNQDLPTFMTNLRTRSGAETACLQGKPRYSIRRSHDVSCSNLPKPGLILRVEYGVRNPDDYLAMPTYFHPLSNLYRGLYKYVLSNSEWSLVKVLYR